VSAMDAQAPTPGRLPAELEERRRTRRHPRPTQFDYLHVRRLVDDLAQALAAIEHPVGDALDVFCGTRPYDDLFPPGARRIGLDVEANEYGVADVVSNEFLPFDDASFDLVTCIEAFHYVEEPEHGIREIRRVLRPGGTALVSIPFAWEYDRTILERRYTGPELAHLFRGWDEVRVVENGGRGIVWATLTGTILDRIRLRLPRPARPVFLPLLLAVNALGAGLDAVDRRWSSGQMVLPMNLLVTARKPADA
jgi:SAM-dependent methyltransferase